MIAAIYARKSTEQNGVADDQKSVARQVEHAKQYAERKGWTVDEQSIFVDDGISGAEFANRPGFLRLLNALKPAPPFQVLIMSEESRLGREMIQTAAALQQILAAGVRLFFYLEDRERTLDTPTDKIMLSLTTFADELEREKARQRTYDAMARKAKAGHVTGGRVFGYDNVDVLTDRIDSSGRPIRAYVDRVINEAEAAVIRRIFEQCAKGHGLTTSAKRLNEEGALSPRSQQGRPAGWSASSIREILFREAYRGLLIWNKTRKRDKHGRRHQSRREATEHVIVRRPDLQIVDDDLWEAAHARLKVSRELYLRDQRGKLWGRPLSPADAKYLLTGLASCGCCGGTLEVRSRQHGRTRKYFYVCATYRRKGPAVCRGIDVPLEAADRVVLNQFERTVLDPAFLQDVCARVLDNPGPAGDGAVLREELVIRKEALETEIGRLTETIANGGGQSKALLLAVTAREAEIARIDRELTHLAGAPRVTPERVRKALDKAIADWRATLRKHAALTRQLLTKVLQGRVVFVPEKREEQPGYRLRGQAAVAPLITTVLKAVGVDVNGAFPSQRHCAHGLASPTRFPVLDLSGPLAA